MPTTSSSTTSASASTGSASRATPPSSADLGKQLAAAQSTTIYVDIPGLDDKGADAYLDGDPPLHVEHDAVRNLWAVRLATPEEAEGL